MEVSYLGKTLKKLPFYVINKLDSRSELDWKESCNPNRMEQNSLGEKKRSKWYLELFCKDDDENFLPIEVSVELDDGGIGPV